MYPTDFIYDNTFNFKETESINDEFENFGYVGRNSIELSGSLPITLLVFIVSQISISRGIFLFINDFLEYL